MTTNVQDIPYCILETRRQWREWLEKSHQSRTEIWLGFYKRGVNKSCVSNSDAVEEALCFGWINGKVHKLDEEIYIQRFSPRHDRSVWSPANKKRVEKLIKQGLMTESGLRAVEIAKANGSWDSVEVEVDMDHIADDIITALKKKRLAFENFKKFAQGQRHDYIWWVESAKRAETRKRRIQQLVERCLKNIKPGQ